MVFPKYWSFSFSICPSNEHPGLISFRMDWLDFLAVQGTLKRLLQHNSSKASILQRSLVFLTNNSQLDPAGANTLAGQIMGGQTVTDNGYTYAMEITSVENHTVCVSITAE